MSNTQITLFDNTEVATIKHINELYDNLIYSYLSKWRIHCAL